MNYNMKIQDKGNYLLIEAQEGHYLTPFKDGDNVRLYFSSRICICPIGKSDNIREITEDENKQYIDLRDNNGKDR